MNKFLENWKNFWGQIGPSQRVSIVLSGLLVMGVMVAVFVWAQRPNMRLLYGSVSAEDASAIVEHLQSQGIAYEMRAGGAAIFVPADQVYQARMDVASQGLVQGDAVGFEIFDKSNFGVSDFIQRTNFVRAVQGELARTVQQLNGVRHARVMVVMPDNRLLLVNDDVATTASVFVDVGGGSLGQSSVRSIQSLVANAVEGLNTSNVAVVDNNGNVLSQERDEDSLLGNSGGIVEYRQSLENYFSGKVESMLERVVGSGNAVVRVSADINSSQVTRLQEDFADEGIVRRRQTQEESSSSVDGNDGGVASMVVEEEDEQAGGQPTPSRTDEERRQQDQTYEIGRTVTNTVEQPGGINRLTASVFVATRVREAEADGEAVVDNRTEAEMQELREMVANALGIPLDDPSRGSVAVREAVFDARPTVGEMTASAGGEFDPMQLLEYGEEIFGSIVALILFLIFLTMLKRSRNQRDVLEQLNEDRQQARAERELGQPQHITPELLNELIRQKPENAGTTLRNWLSGKAAE